MTASAAIPTCPTISQNGNCLVYTGTHDNNTSNGWFYGPETSEATKLAILDYMNLGHRDEFHWQFIRLAMQSVARLAMFPVQDILGYDQRFRMNTPGQGRGQLELALDPRGPDRGDRPPAAPFDRPLQPQAARLSRCPDFGLFDPSCHKNRTNLPRLSWQPICFPKIEEDNMKKTMIAIACLLLLAGACWSQDSETNGNEVKYYDNAKVVRIKNVDGEGFVQRSYEEGNEEATANLPLFEKDTVGTTEGRLGIYLGRLNYLRLDSDSTVVLEKIPELRKTDLSVRVENGGIYLDIESLDNERGIEIQTPDCGVFILDKGVYRDQRQPGLPDRSAGHGGHRRSDRPGTAAATSGKTRRSSWPAARSPKGPIILPPRKKTILTAGTKRRTAS